MSSLIPSLHQRHSLSILLLLCLGSSLSLAQDQKTAARPDRVLADFEGSGFGEWQPSGGAGFGTGPKTTRPLPGISGRGYASTENSDPETKGTLTSPPFLIDRDYLNLLIGGDKGGGTFVRLKIDGETAATLPALTADRLYPASLDLRPFQGKTALLEIRDTAADKKTDKFVAVDQIVLSDRSSLETLEKTLKADGDYLLLPVSRSGRPALLKLIAEGEVFQQGDILLPQGAPEAWISFRLPEDRKGRDIRVVVENAPPGTHFLENVRSSSAPHDASSLYGEKLRPQFHFSSQSGWLNDPNGMIFHEGEWHLFFQYNALGFDIGNQSWGHAVSTDLVHWKELPHVLPPYVFARGKSYSGSAVLDRENRSGLGTKESPPLLVFFTDTGYQPRAECLAFSTDQGRTFRYYEGNPVYQHPENGRDPKVFWYPVDDRAQAAGHWVMVVYSLRKGEDGLSLLVSDDLRKWTETDWVPGHYECPELFQLPVQSESGQPTGERKWVIQGGNSSYVLGDFDGRKFTPLDGRKHQAVRLPAYAGQCFNDAPGGRTIQISWIRRHMKWEGMPFSQMMTVPLELSLRSTTQGLRLFAEPVKELETLRSREFRKGDIVLAPGQPLTVPLEGQLYDLEISYECPPDSRLKIKLGADEIVCSGDGTIAGIPAGGQKGTVRILVDRPLIEVIGNHGAFYLPKPREDAGQDIRIELAAEGQPVKLESLRAFELRSIWPAPTTPVPPSPADTTSTLPAPIHSWTFDTLEDSAGKLGLTLHANSIPPRRLRKFDKRLRNPPILQPR